MNAKKAKIARRIAREASVGLPEVAYLRRSKTGEILVDPKTTKGIYRKIKKDIKRAYRN